MQQKRSSWSAIVIVVIAILAVYVSRYYALSDKDYMSYSGDFTLVRVCRYHWMMKAYQPLAAIESRMTGEKVVLVFPW